MLHFTEAHVRDVLNGRASALCCAFVWEETPQGIAYWANIAYGRKPLDPEGRAFLEGLLASAPAPVVPSYTATVPTGCPKGGRKKVRRRYTTGSPRSDGSRRLAGRDAAVSALRSAGYERLGQGSRSAAYVHPDRPDVVVRVGRYDVKSPAEDGCDPVDGWLHYFDTVISKTRSVYAPKVYSVTLYDDHYVVEMERLGAIDGDRWGDVRDAWDINDPNMDRYMKRVLAAAENKPEGSYGGLDWHDGNVMVRPSTGQLVVTDPIYLTRP